MGYGMFEQQKPRSTAVVSSPASWCQRHFFFFFLPNRRLSVRFFLHIYTDTYTQYIYTNTQISFKTAYISVNAWGGFAYMPTQGCRGGDCQLPFLYLCFAYSRNDDMRDHWPRRPLRLPPSAAMLMGRGFRTYFKLSEKWLLPYTVYSRRGGLWRSDWDIFFFYTDEDQLIQLEIFWLYMISWYTYI